MKYLYLIVLTVVMIGGSAWAGSDTQCNNTYPETVYNSSTDTCVCPTNLPLSWNKYTYCGFMNGTPKVDIQRTNRANTTTTTRPTVTKPTTTKPTTKKESKVTIKLKDKKCKRQNSDSYYDTSSRKCRTTNYNTTPSRSYQTYYDVFECVSDTKRQKIESNTTTPWGTLYDSSKTGYPYNTIVYTRAGLIPSSIDCTVLDIYQCSNGQWRNLYRNQSYLLGRYGDPLYQKRVTQYSNSQQYDEGSYVYLPGPNSQLIGSCTNTTTYYAQCNELRNRQTVRTSQSATKRNPNKDYRVGDIVYYTNRDQLNNQKCGYISSQSACGNGRIDTYEECDGEAFCNSSCRVQSLEELSQSCRCYRDGDAGVNSYGDISFSNFECVSTIPGFSVTRAQYRLYEYVFNRDNNGGTSYTNPTFIQKIDIPFRTYYSNTFNVSGYDPMMRRFEVYGRYDGSSKEYRCRLNTAPGYRQTLIN